MANYHYVKNIYTYVNKTVLCWSLYRLKINALIFHNWSHCRACKTRPPGETPQNMITISIKHLFAILEIRGKEAENTVGHSWPYCRAYRVVCQRTPGAKAAVFPAPKLFAKLTTGSRCLAYRCDSQKHVNIHSWKCHQKNNIDFTTGLFTHLSLFRKRPHNVPTLPASLGHYKCS